MRVDALHPLNRVRWLSNRLTRFLCPPRDLVGKYRQKQAQDHVAHDDLEHDDELPHPVHWLDVTESERRVGHDRVVEG